VDKTGQYKYLFRALSLLAVTITIISIFGMIFFIFPLIGMVIMDVSEKNSYKEVKFKLFLQTFFSYSKNRSFGGASLFLIIFCIFPYG
jgi:hypothetical protein